MPDQPNDEQKPKLIIEGDWKNEARAEQQSQAQAQDEAKPDLSVDADWKAQAQQEKLRLAQEADTGGEQANQLPEADFRTLVSTMVTQALMAMGAIPEPSTGQRVAVLDLAKFHIDMLGVLEEKTKGNITDEESKMLSGALHELRMQFLHLQQTAAQQAQQQPQGGPGPQGAGGQSDSLK
jgi:hypothetical protein